MPELKPLDGTDYYIWKYLPSIPLAAAFGGAFLLVTVVHVVRTVRTGTHFNHIFALGGLFQVLGYISRIAAHWHTNSLAIYIIQNCLIILAPIFYAASVYMCLSRIVRSTGGEAYSVFRPRWITRVFVLADLVTLNVQGNGAGLTANDSDGVAVAGKWIVIVGLVIQVVTVGFFVYVGGVWHWRMAARYVKGEEEGSELVGGAGEAVGVGAQNDTVSMGGEGGRAERLPWRQAMWMLYVCSVLIGVRSVFRLIEYVQGTEGWLLSHEWPMYAFDSSLMLLLQIVYVLWFPGEFKVEMGERRRKWMRLLH